MRNLILFIILYIFFVTISYAEEDPFSRTFTPQAFSPDAAIISSDLSSDKSVHPMIRYDINNYFLKGVVYSQKGSLAIVSLPGSPDYILFEGDPIGNDMHTIQKIETDFIVVGKSNGDEVSISVLNPNSNELLN